MQGFSIKNAFCIRTICFLMIFLFLFVIIPGASANISDTGRPKWLNGTLCIILPGMSGSGFSSDVAAHTSLECLFFFDFTNDVVKSLVLGNNSDLVRIPEKGALPVLLTKSVLTSSIELRIGSKGYAANDNEALLSDCWYTSVYNAYERIYRSNAKEKEAICIEPVERDHDGEYTRNLNHYTYDDYRECSRYLRNTKFPGNTDTTCDSESSEQLALMMENDPNLFTSTTYDYNGQVIQAVAIHRKNNRHVFYPSFSMLEMKDQDGVDFFLLDKEYDPVEDRNEIKLLKWNSETSKKEILDTWPENGFDPLYFRCDVSEDGKLAWTYVKLPPRYISNPDMVSGKAYAVYVRAEGLGDNAGTIELMEEDYPSAYSVGHDTHTHLKDIIIDLATGTEYDKEPRLAYPDQDTFKVYDGEKVIEVCLADHILPDGHQMRITDLCWLNNQEIAFNSKGEELIGTGGWEVAPLYRYSIDVWDIASGSVKNIAEHWEGEKCYETDGWINCSMALSDDAAYLAILQENGHYEKYRISVIDMETGTEYAFDPFTSETNGYRWFRTEDGMICMSPLECIGVRPRMEWYPTEEYR